MIQILWALRAPIALAVLVTALLGLYWSQIEAAETRGQMAERAIWQKAAESNKRAADTFRIKLLTEAREKEAAHAEKIAAIDVKYQQELGRAKTQHKTDLANVRSGAIRLRDPNAASCGSADSDTSSTTGVDTGQRNDRTTGQLSREAAEFLFTLASDADEIARQLTSAQAVIRELERVCRDR